MPIRNSIVCSVIDDGNELEEQTLYDPYGMPMVDVNSRSDQPYKFGGKEMDRTGGQANHI